MSEIAPTTIDTETTPLLRNEDEAQKFAKRPVTPLPKLQLTLICLIRVVEPICFQLIFPFINQMLLDVGAAKDPESVGYAAGLSIFSITQLLTVFHWGALSDRIGRKPVLIIGCIGSSVSAIAFGLSKSFTMLIITRCLNGVMNGNIGVLKAIMSEISDETNESKAFSFFPLCLNVGVLIASFIGGTFASVDKFPKLGNALPIFKEYPYLLPNLLGAVLPLVAAALAAIWLKETLPPREERDAENDAADPEERSYKSLFTPQINALMFSFAVLSLLGGSIMAILPLFCFTPVRDGGLSFSESQIGTSMSIRAVGTIIAQLLAFPWLQRRFGSLKLYRWCMILWIPAYIGLPILNGFARLDQQALVWVGMVLTLSTGAVANMAFVCNLIMTNAAAPSRHLLGAINGYAAVLSSLVRVFGPGGASVLFAISINKQILAGNLVWVVFSTIGVVGVVSGIMIRSTSR